MFRNHARKLVLALSLFAAVSSLLPGSQITAAAAPIPAAESAADVRLDPVKPVKPKPEFIARKLIWEVQTPTLYDNGITTYHFRLRAIGGPHGNVKVTKEADYVYNYNGVSWTGHIADIEWLGTLYDGEVKDVYMMCEPPILHARCTSASVIADSLEGLHVWKADPTDGNVRTTNSGY